MTRTAFFILLLTAATAAAQRDLAGFPTRAGGAGTPGTASRWYTAFDCDFTTQPSQTLTGDNNFTICGVTWTKQNSANEASTMSVSAGTGLTIRPTATTDLSPAAATAPLIWAPLQTLVPDFSVMQPIAHRARSYRVSLSSRKS